MDLPGFPSPFSVPSGVKGSVLGFETNPFVWFVTMIRVSEQQDLGTQSYGGLGKPISRFTTLRDDIVQLSFVHFYQSHFAHPGA